MRFDAPNFQAGLSALLTDSKTQNVYSLSYSFTRLQLWEEGPVPNYKYKKGQYSPQYNNTDPFVVIFANEYIQ